MLYIHTLRSRARARPRRGSQTHTVIRVPRNTHEIEETSATRTQRKPKEMCITHTYTDGSRRTQSNTQRYPPVHNYPEQNNDNNYHLYASAVITCTRAEHAFNFVSNLNNSNKSLLPALLLPPAAGHRIVAGCTLYDSPMSTSSTREPATISSMRTGGVRLGGRRESSLSVIHCSCIRA